MFWKIFLTFVENRKNIMANYTDEQLDFINYSGTDSIILSATAGSGKEQPLFCKVLTPNGWVRMGDLKCGDEVLTPTGEISKITNIYPQGIKEVFKITFSDGSFTYAGHEHLWKVQTRNQRSTYSKNYSVLTTDKIAQKLFKTDSRGIKYKFYYIPLTDIAYKEKNLPIDPYLLGCLLGDGGMSRNSQVTFTNSDQLILDEIKKLIEKYDLKLKEKKGDPGNYYISKEIPNHKNELIDQLRSLGLMEHLSVGKFIPKEYLTASKEQRLRLLNGLLDTDGYVDKNSVYITLSSKQMSDDIVELVNSIGGIVYVTLKKGRYKKNGIYVDCNQAYVMSICLPKELKYKAFTLPRKKDLLADKGKTYIPYRAFDKIEFYDNVECQCIEIDHTDHLYVTDNHIVTHNTHSTVGRLNKMVDDGVDPQKIIFFSFTNDAVDELKRRIKHDVKITTIHSFTASLLGKMGRFKKIATFYDFVNWYKEKYKPAPRAPKNIKDEYQQMLTFFYEEGNQVSASFSAFKLQTSDGFKLPKPEHYVDYDKFLRETQSRDFADMLIDTEKLSRDPKYIKYFEGLYDHIFVDEYQDTSTLQLKILLAIKAKQYYLIGDENQSIYGFSGANCDMIEQLLTSKHKTTRMTLTKNFRSDKKIVEHANKYSKITAIPHSENDGSVKYDLIDKFDLIEMINDDRPLAILVRTNNVIKDLEEYCLKSKLKIRYNNFITNDELRHIKENNINPSLKRRLDRITSYFVSVEKLVQFIEANKESMKFITSIHKSKGREFPRCVIVNSLDPELAERYGVDDDYTYLTKDGDIDQEERNVHYVAVTRPMHEVYFMIF